jgi:hypothetical protein
VKANYLNSGAFLWSACTDQSVADTAEDCARCRIAAHPARENAAACAAYPGRENQHRLRCRTSPGKGEQKSNILCLPI